jgi:hypothetical protein
MLNFEGKSSAAGANPFAGFSVDGTPLSSVVTLWDPPGADSKAVYASISNKMAALVEEAIRTRAKY